jgi:predicted house-cleaning noncanonical NTP pyrophosphatase (MazG superfamily)
VDCGAATLGDDVKGAVSKFASREKVRHKSRFLADSGNGDWVFEQVTPPWDRRRSITRESWIFLIAYFTKRFAQFVNRPINMMWFVGIDKQHVGSELIPWYHEEATQLTPVSKAPDTRRIAGQYPTIKNSNDVEQLMRSPQLRGSRVKAVRLDPDQSALRDRAFALKVAELSRTHQIRIELAGGILAHTYYLLVQHGAIVDCIDPFESAEDAETFGKLVRDKVPEKVASGGEAVEYGQLTGEALIGALKAKVLEESLEVFEAVGRGSLVEELADLEEVVAALCERLELDTSEIQNARSRKNRQRGSFDKGYVLLRTRTPALESRSTEAKLLNGMSVQGDARVIDGPLVECAASASETHRFTINVPLIPPHLTKEASTTLTVGRTTYSIAAKNSGKMVQLTVEVTAAPEQLTLFPEPASSPLKAAQEIPR